MLATVWATWAANCRSLGLLLDPSPIALPITAISLYDMLVIASCGRLAAGT
jgi:hypothetical protein